MEQVALTVEVTVKQLLEQRCDFSKQLKAGDANVQVGIEFIDNMLSQLVPDYVPPLGRGCCCKET